MEAATDLRALLARASSRAPLLSRPPTLNLHTPFICAPRPALSTHPTIVNHLFVLTTWPCLILLLVARIRRRRRGRRLRPRGRLLLRPLLRLLRVTLHLYIRLRLRIHPRRAGGRPLRPPTNTRTLILLPLPIRRPLPFWQPPLRIGLREGGRILRVEAFRIDNPLTAPPLLLLRIALLLLLCRRPLFLSACVGFVVERGKAACSNSSASIISTSLSSGGGHNISNLL